MYFHFVTNIVSSNPARARCTHTLCDKVCQSLSTGLWFSPGTPVFFTNKTDSHDIQSNMFVSNTLYSNTTDVSKLPADPDLFSYYSILFQHG